MIIEARLAHLPILRLKPLIKFNDLLHCRQVLIILDHAFTHLELHALLASKALHRAILEIML